MRQNKVKLRQVLPVFIVLLFLFSYPAQAAPPTVTAFSANTNEDTTVSIDLKPYASDMDGDELTYYVFNPIKGSVTVDSISGMATFTPKTNYIGSSSGFYFSAKDATRSSSLAKVTVTINPINDVPTASNISESATEDKNKQIALKGSDAETISRNLIYRIVSGPSHGTVSIWANKAVYLSSVNYNGPDSFTYRASDGSLESGEATVSLTVASANDKPTASSASISMDEDAIATITLSASDPDGDSLAYSIAASPSHGSVNLSGSQVTYTPEANYNETDSFTFIANDGTDNSDPAAVSISITPVNDKPVADAVSLTIDEDTIGTITLSGTDVDNDTLSFVLGDNPTKGNAVIEHQNISYTPSTNKNGKDTFTYRAYDGQDYSEIQTATLTITPINDFPTISAISDTVEAGKTLILSLGASDPDGDSLTYSFTSSKVASSGSDYVYTAADEEGIDNSEYTACDTEGYCVSETVTIQVFNSEPTGCAQNIPESFANQGVALGMVWYNAPASKNPITRRVLVKITFNNGVTASEREATTSTDDDGCFYAPYDDQEEKAVQVDYYAISSSTYMRADGSYQKDPDNKGPDYCNGASWEIKAKDTTTDNEWGVAQASFTDDFSFMVIDGDQQSTNVPINQMTWFEDSIDKSTSISFQALDTTLGAMEVVCSADSDATFGTINIEEDISNTCNNDDYGCYADSTKTMYYGHNDVDVYQLTYIMGHEFAHYLQHNFYTMRDYTAFVARLDSVQHYYSDLIDPRMAFTEGFADGFGNYIYESFWNKTYYDYSTAIDISAGISSELNVGYVIYKLISEDGYSRIHDTYKTDMPTTPVFQTLHSFGYYYSGIKSYFEEIGIPTDSLNDLYDKDNKVGQYLGSFYAIYPRIVFAPEGTQTGYYRDFPELVSSIPELLDWTHDYFRWHSLSYHKDNECITNMNDCYEAWLMEGAGYYKDGALDFTGYRSGNYQDDMAPGHTAPEHDLIDYRSSDTYKSTAAGASRWFVVDGNQFQFDCFDAPNVICGGNSELGMPGSNGKHTINLAIADDDSTDDRCTKNLNLVAYKDGIKYAEADGLCPEIDVSNDGTYIIEVYSNNITQDVDCFSLMDEHYCEEN